MRVITGSARGMTLKAPEGLSTRPTAEKVKEAVFSALQFEIEGRRVLDLFAGSGQMGIEALSRGAVSAVFVDADKTAVRIIKENLQKTRFAPQATVMQTDAFAYLRMCGQAFDLAFLDPPYAVGLLQKALAAVEPLIAEGGAVVCEHPADEALPDAVGLLRADRRYHYGKTAVTVFRKGGVL
ncbi:MAG: 16S rRNA (guanine(966)-N(2))-methyltransferase RsmD [Clostridia bacterium]|nr:16S rRNA (guanine(966)-N(2))-methyltransferase RsmD [Clostridia bacterium]